MNDANRTADKEEWGLWMQAAQAGDQNAYARLLTALTVFLRARLGRILGAGFGNEIEDVVQEILLSLHSVRHTYDPKRPFLPWLMSIARHRTLDFLRKRLRARAREISVAVFDETFLDLAAKEENDYGDPEALRQALSHLPEGQRRALELLKIEGLSLKEAAAASGQSIASLKVAAHRGVKALRSLMTGKERQS